MGNAHRTRPRKKLCSADCMFCKFRPKAARKLFKLFKNSNGHRHNPAANKKQKKG